MFCGVRQRGSITNWLKRRLGSKRQTEKDEFSNIKEWNSIKNGDELIQTSQSKSIDSWKSIHDRYKVMDGPRPNYRGFIGKELVHVAIAQPNCNILT